MTHPKTLLEQYGIDAKKSLGQNFLYDENLLQRIVSAAEVTAERAGTSPPPPSAAGHRRSARR